MVRSICEEYKCLPSDVENLTADQILVLALDRKKLAWAGKRWTGTPAELVTAGVVPRMPGGSYVQRLRAQRRAAATASNRAARRERRAARRTAILNRRGTGDE